MEKPFDAGFYESLLKNIIDIVTVIDPQGVILYQSQSVSELGYTVDDMVGTNVLDYLHPDDYESALVSLSRTVNGQDDEPFFRCRFKRRDGGWSWLEARGDVLKDAPVEGVILSTREITDLQHMLSEVQRSKELLDAAFHATSTIFSVTRPGTGEFLAVNSAWEDVSGWTREEALGRTANDLNIWGNPENRQKMLDAFDGSGQLTGLRMNIQTKSGEQRTIVMDARLLQLQEGERMLLSAVDVTEREELESQLLQAQKMEALGQLTGGIAHDFNNLLSVIVGHAEMLDQMMPESELKESLSAIQQAADNGARLVQSLLAFSRKQLLRPQAFSLSERINSLKPLLKTTLNKEVVLDVHLGAKPDLCRLDASQFDSAILNLAINAQQAMPGPGSLRIETRNRTVAAGDPGQLSPGEYLEVVISDTGIGMSAAAMEKAFDPFFTTRQTSGGSGLGLSMVFGFVTQSGGDVSIHSTEGEGTVVTLTVPSVDGADD